jgi:hypothetical protein
MSWLTARRSLLVFGIRLDRRTMTDFALFHTLRRMCSSFASHSSVLLVTKTSGQRYAITPISASIKNLNTVVSVVSRDLASCASDVGRTCGYEAGLAGGSSDHREATGPVRGAIHCNVPRLISFPDAWPPFNIRRVWLWQRILEQ